MTRLAYSAAHLAGVPGVAGQSTAGDDALEIHRPAKCAPRLVKRVADAMAAFIRGNANLGPIERVAAVWVMGIENTVVGDARPRVVQTVPLPQNDDGNRDAD